jgi:uncharacterized protein (TIGR00297 family)
MLILLLVLPATAVSVVLEGAAYADTARPALVAALGLSGLLGLAAWKLRTATPAAAFTGAAITASMMFSTFVFPYLPWRTALTPILVLLILTSLSTRFGRRRKERLGTAEERRGRGAAQVAANLGVASLVTVPAVQTVFAGWVGGAAGPESPFPLFALGLAALAEAAADTVSSEIGQVLGGTPRMITTLRRVEPGTDGGVTVAGTLAGMTAALIVAAAGAAALHGGVSMLVVSWVGGVFGLLFDSLLGATLERAGWLNNDAVNFLSTASAAALALLLLIASSHRAAG